MNYKLQYGKGQVGLNLKCLTQRYSLQYAHCLPGYVQLSTKISNLARKVDALRGSQAVLIKGTAPELDKALEEMENELNDLLKRRRQIIEQVDKNNLFWERNNFEVIRQQCKRCNKKN